jgi:hypothetical protein
MGGILEVFKPLSKFFQIYFKNLKVLGPRI